MLQVTPPYDAKMGLMKPEVRAAMLDKLGSRPADHFVDAGPCTGSVATEAARRVERVTAAERRPD